MGIQIILRKRFLHDILFHNYKSERMMTLIKYFVAGFTIVGMLFLASCSGSTTTTSTVATLTYPSFNCPHTFSETMNESIPIQSLTSVTSSITGDLNRFICPSAESTEISFSDSLIKSHKIVFDFDASYPIQSMFIDNSTPLNGESIALINIETSLNGIGYTFFLRNYELSLGENTIDFGNQNAKFVRLSFASTSGISYSLQKVEFRLGAGYIVKEDPDWHSAFRRLQDWTGGDGIFSFDLNGASEWSSAESKVAFVFGDTFLANVNPTTGIRLNGPMLNNSVGYYDGVASPTDGLTFDYGRTALGLPQSAFLPDAYIGYTENNLLSTDGISIYPSKDGLLGQIANGMMWRSNQTTNNSLTINFETLQTIDKLYLWNENNTPTFGVKDIRIDTSVNGVDFTLGNTYTLPQATGEANEPYSLEIELEEISCKSIKIVILSSYSSETVGLGKILLLDGQENPVFGRIQAANTLDTIEGNELSSRLWSQDGIVLGEYLYLIPLLIKDFPGAFYVPNAGLLQIPIVDGVLDLENTLSLTSPLYAIAPDGGQIFFGAGILDNRSVDGYIYVYGYKDYLGRKLVVSRTTESGFTDFNTWEYFDGTDFSKNILDVAPIASRVSPELSVTYMTEGMNAGKYMLVVMEGTTSGDISYALSDTPYSTFSDYHLLYETNEGTTLNAFTYNAKMHPILSTPDAFRISYNVNTSNWTQLSKVDIYYPRFILVTEVKAPEGD